MFNGMCKQRLAWCKVSLRTCVSDIDCKQKKNWKNKQGPEGRLRWGLVGVVQELTPSQHRSIPEPAASLNPPSAAGEGPSAFACPERSSVDAPTLYVFGPAGAAE